MGKKGKLNNNGDPKKLSKEDLAFLVGHTKYSKAELKEWHKRFLDECPEGSLSKKDLHSMYAKMIPKEDPTVIINHLFRIFDRDNSGTIDFKEYVLATEISTSADPEEKLRWTFKMYDKDGSGTIELAEMVEVLETVYVMEGMMSENMAKTRAKQIFQELDANGDGSLTCDEFVKGCMKDQDMVALLTKKEEITVAPSEAKKKSGGGQRKRAK